MADVQSTAFPRNRKPRAKKKALRLDMAPMAGLAFLLLTFFLLAHNLLKPNVRQLNMPEKYRADEERSELWDPGMITLILGNNGHVHYYYSLIGYKDSTILYNTEIQSVEFYQLLLALKKESPVIFIKNTSDAKYQDLVGILDKMQATHQQHYLLADMTSDERILLVRNGL